MGRRQAGFTLVEVMVALVIMTVMALLAWRGLDALLTSRTISQQHLDQSVRLQSVLEQWELDMRGMQDTVKVPQLTYDGSTLRITRQRAGGMQVVAWSVRNGGLYRWESPVVQSVVALLQGFQQAGALQGQAGIRVLDGVAGWQMYYYRNNSWTNAQSTGATPTGVRMLLQFGADSGFAGPLTREIVVGPSA
ncbi:prepilin-type N-terminal cleavage/methylation domain-containing protein [Pelomonas sp. KK5]|uniref:prepilin-type N-terminal cleavage/methylation domain-containing protein n=1 Tax=Pelomonas sp. KK5 TaxID=1855730 RepID=UPI00097BB6FA|nr:prepilin-type N-terminal cleavage/methylation domain-containing protein [Pelomonas sp. KK5]